MNLPAKGRDIYEKVSIGRMKKVGASRDESPLREGRSRREGENREKGKT